MSKYDIYMGHSGKRASEEIHARAEKMIKRQEKKHNIGFDELTYTKHSGEEYIQLKIIRKINDYLIEFRGQSNFEKDKKDFKDFYAISAEVHLIVDGEDEPIKETLFYPFSLLNDGYISMSKIIEYIKTPEAIQYIDTIRKNNQHIEDLRKNNEKIKDTMLEEINKSVWSKSK